MSKLEIHQFPIRGDNYAVLLHDHDANVTASIDAGDGTAITNELAQKGWTLSHIFITHHHGDHTEGNRMLKEQSGCTIVGPRAEAASIPLIDQPVAQDERVQFGNFNFQVLDTPGHTAGHISYFEPSEKIAFVGDTLFALGCGRLFEGDAQTMWTSLSKLIALPADTQIYCGHEYTKANAAFALTIEPENDELQARAKLIAELRAEGKPTIPTTMALELATNPFLRPHSTAIRARLGMLDAADWEVFGEIRRRKDVT